MNEPIQSASATPGADASTHKRRRYGPLWIMLFLFGTPYLAAGIFYLVQDLRDWLPQANHGQLISPLRPLADITLPGFDGAELRPNTLNGQWTLLYWTRSDCDDACAETLYFMRQVRLAMGRERFNIERVALLPQATPQKLRATLAQHQPQMQLAIADSVAAGNWLQGLDLDGRSRLFLIDPQGRPALFYQPPIDPKHLLDDLERLLGGRG